MKKYLLVVLTTVLYFSSKATNKDSTIYYNLPDSVRATQFMAEVTVTNMNQSKALKIPPNSILVFEVEVVDVKAP